MKKNIGMFIFLIILVTILLILGNQLHRYSILKNIGLEDVYSKDKGENYTILIEVDRKQLKLVDRENESIIKTYPIASGKPSSPTPLGTFKIVEKAQWGEGFGTRWMGLNVPWGTCHKVHI